MTVFITHPVLLAISFLTGIAYFLLLQGGKRTIKYIGIFVLPLMVIIALSNPMFNHYGVTTLGYLSNGNPFTLESCVYGAIMALMLGGVLLWFGCSTKVLTSDKFLYLFGKILPALSLVLSMSLRFVPKFMGQMQKIIKAQKGIGRDASGKRVIPKVKQGMKTFSILITWSLESAIETSDSMKCRGYGQKGRTAFSMYRFTMRDGICLIFMAVTYAISLWGIQKGWAYSLYNPQIKISGIPVTLHSFLIYASFAVFCLIPSVLELAERYYWNKRRDQIDQQKITKYRLWEDEEIWNDR